MYSKVGGNNMLIAFGNLLHLGFLFFFFKQNRTPLFNLIIEVVVTK